MLPAGRSDESRSAWRDVATCATVDLLGPLLVALGLRGAISEGGAQKPAADMAVFYLDDGSVCDTHEGFPRSLPERFWTTEAFS